MADRLLLCCCFRNRVLGLPVGPLLRALHRRAAALAGRHLRLQEGRVLRGRLLALRPPLDLAPLAGLEPLRARRSRDHVLCPVAPAFAGQRLVCAVPLHLLPAAAVPAHGLLLRPHPAGSQKGELNLPQPVGTKTLRVNDIIVHIRRR